jgi:5-formyltetrahydrofolate cyclo-ligase
MKKKEEVREFYREKRAAIPKEDRVLQSIDMCRMLSLWDVLHSAYGISSYMAINEEVTLLRLMDILMGERIPFAFPRVNGDQMEFIEYNDNLDFEKSAFGIQEPVGGRPITWEKAVVLVPGIAFDLKGNRLGYGKGYYDRFLKEHPNYLAVGVCFMEQVSEEELPCDKEDVKMSYLALPDRVIRI